MKRSERKRERVRMQDVVSNQKARIIEARVKPKALTNNDLFQLKDSRGDICMKIPRNLRGGKLCNIMVWTRNTPH